MNRKAERKRKYALPFFIVCIFVLIGNVETLEIVVQR